MAEQPGQVRRFEPMYGTKLDENPYGDYVLYRDYEALARENERLRDALAFILQEFEWCISIGLIRGFEMTRDKARAALNPSKESVHG